MDVLAIYPEFPGIFWGFGHALQLTDDRELVGMIVVAGFNTVFIDSEHRIIPSATRAEIWLQISSGFNSITPASIQNQIEFIPNNFNRRE